MARQINFEKDVLNKTVKDYFTDFITDTFTANEFNIKLYKKSIEIKTKPKLQFTTEAYTQMLALIEECSEEIAWLGRVHRNGINFLIDKLYVFPQIVTRASVTPDETAYVNWNMQLTTEEINSMRFHGHSHVNMGVFASGIDTKMYNELLAELKQNDFYIFLIGNKKNEFIYWIYDLATNIVYEKQDIIFEVLDENGNAIKSWAKDNIEKYIKPQSQLYNSIYNTNTINNTNNLNNNHNLSSTKNKAYEYNRYRELEQIPLQELSMEEYLEYTKLASKITANKAHNKNKRKKYKNNKQEAKKQNARFN